MRRGSAARGALCLLAAPPPALAMHIMEGFLPPTWALAWWLLFRWQRWGAR